MALESDQIYLVVLSHGLWGNKGHMSFIENKIKEKYDNQVYILNSSVNEAKYSYDGVDICGERLAKDIEATVVRLGKNGKKVKKISIVGYSLGGLITRYAIGILGQRGFFNTIEPDYYVTFATPHMGVKLPSRSIFPTVFKFVSGRFVSRSGDQLQLRDGYDSNQHKPVLEVLSDPDSIYFKYLSKFKTRRTYINIANDRTVPYWSAGMEIKDYFYNNKGKLDIDFDDFYVSIVTAFDLKLSEKKVSIQKNKQKPRPAYLNYLYYCLFPVVAPVIVVLALSVIGVQGIISRLRVHQMLSHKERLLLEDNDNSSISEAIDSRFLAGALDAINIPGEQTTPPQHHSSAVTLNNEAHNYSKVEPSKELEKYSKTLDFDDVTIRISQNLKLLDWERVWVYINAFNAHGSIVCRQNRFTNEGGKATIQHFIDTTQFKL